MARKDTDHLISTLARGLTPVRTLRSPMIRASGALTVVFLILGFSVWLKADLAVFAARHTEPRMIMESLAILLTGICAVIAAFYLSIPGRSTLWLYLPLPPLAIWTAASSLGCIRTGASLGSPPLGLPHSMHCFIFIVAVSVPAIAFLFVLLRRARPLNPIPVSLAAALGAAAVAAFALEFFHPFDITRMDFSFHLAAVGAVIAPATKLRYIGETTPESLR